MVNQTGSLNLSIGVSDTENTTTKNAPNLIYKIYDKDTYFPQISWERVYNHIKKT
jgi:hypothetical protein